MVLDKDGNVICYQDKHDPIEEIERVHVSLSEGLRSVRSNLSAFGVNAFLEGRGVLAKKERISKVSGKTKTFLIVTEKWYKFAFNQQSRMGHEGTIVRYYKDSFMDFMLQVGLIR